MLGLHLVTATDFRLRTLKLLHCKPRLHYLLLRGYWCFGVRRVIVLGGFPMFNSFEEHGGVFIPLPPTSLYMTQKWPHLPVCVFLTTFVEGYAPT